MNVDSDGNASTIVAGYYKFGYATLLGGGYGVSGTVIMEINEEYTDKRDAGRDGLRNQE